MAGRTLDGMRVAILATDGFEQDELLEPRRALDQAGAETQVVSPKSDRIDGWSHAEWGEQVKVDLPLARAKVADFDALLLPGGVMNPDKLRVIPEAVAFVRGFFDADKPVAAICHGPWTIIESGHARGSRGEARTRGREPLADPELRPADPKEHRHDGEQQRPRRPVELEPDERRDERSEAVHLRVREPRTAVVDDQVVDSIQRGVIEDGREQHDHVSDVLVVHEHVHRHREGREQDQGTTHGASLSDAPGGLQRQARSGQGGAASASP